VERAGRPRGAALLSARRRSRLRGPAPGRAGAGVGALLVVAAAAAAAVAVARERARRRIEARVAARLPLGPDGVVRGAGPVALDAPPAPDGRPAPAALVLHGFGDTPQSVAELARHLHAAGWTVRVPLLPGHGRTARAFAAVRAAEWLDAARDAYAALRTRAGAAPGGAPVALVGQSMGAALAAVLAAEAAAADERVPALVLLAPYLAAPASVRWGARLAPLLALGVAYLSSDGGARSIHDAEARAQALGCGIVTPHLVRELARIVDLARRALPRIAAPTLAVLSRLDNRVAPADGAAAFARVGAAARRPPVKALVWLGASGHVIAADRERARVFALAEAWLARHGGARRPGRAVRPAARDAAPAGAARAVPA
jgi:carboxylesterase